MKTRYVITASCFDRKGRLISVGTNSYKKSHPLQAYFARKVGEPFKTNLHAEVHALIQSKGKQVHTLLVQRFDSQGNPKLAKPCKICQEAMRAFGVTKAIYTTESGKEELYI